MKSNEVTGCFLQSG